MILKEIEIENFRNIKNVKFTPGDKLTVICGKNGQGKTNLLESIWMLTGSKSFRGVKDSLLINKGEEFSILKGMVNNANNRNENEEINCEESNIKITISGDNTLNNKRKGRYAFVNGVDYGRATNIAGIVNAIVFEPNHLKLVKGSPENRRKFIDAALCQIYPSYISVLRKYIRITTQKNALLKQFYKTQGAKELLDIYNENMAQTGEIITQKRAEYLKNFNDIAYKHYDNITSGKEIFNIEYMPCYKENLLFELNKSKEKDINAGFCTAGPHREDLIFSINNNDAKTFASQGQQRSIVLALKLAEAQLIYDITSEKPIVLLDDVLSELDEFRQDYLLHQITDTQTIVTSCDKTAFLRTNGVIYTVENGCLI